MTTYKKFLVILISSLLIFSSAFAQENASGNNYLLQRIGVDAKILVYGGVSIPLGKFANENDGTAKTGFTGGIQFMYNGCFGPVLHFSYSANKIHEAYDNNTDQSKTWKNYLLMGGVNVFSGKITPYGNYYVAPLVGVVFGQKPAIHYYYYRWVNEITDADNAAAFAAGLTAGISMKDITLGVLFVYAAPKYETQGYLFPAIYPVGDRNPTNKFEILQVSLGYAF